MFEEKCFFFRLAEIEVGIQQKFENNSENLFDYTNNLNTNSKRNYNFGN